MRRIEGFAVYVLWLREMKRFFRARSRVVGTIVMPLFFLAFMGLGFRRSTLPGLPAGVGYVPFLVPGILGMSLLFSSTFAGLSVLWDREFGFLKEIMVAPVGRLAIVLGRMAGGVSTSLLQVAVILLIAAGAGFRPVSLLHLPLALLFMLLTSTTFIGVGLIFASHMRDLQGFNIIMNFVVFPLYFLSGAMFPLHNLPAWVRLLAHLDPLTYGVDGMRGALIGHSVLPPAVNLLVLAGFALAAVIIGAWSFEHSETVG